jgi:hypothetical protein
MGVRFGLMMRWLGEDVEFIGSCSELLCVCVCVQRWSLCVVSFFFANAPNSCVFHLMKPIYI